MSLIVLLDPLVSFDRTHTYKMTWSLYFCFIGNAEAVESEDKHRIDMNCNNLLSFFHYKVSDYPVFFENDVPFECKSFARSFQENTHIMSLLCKSFMCFVFREC